MNIIELVKANYGTYKKSSSGSRERHWIRLAASFFISLVLSIFSSDASTAYTIMVTVATILTGFTFTALFSNHTLADIGLPKAVNESDRQDLLRLGLLSKNFKARSAYFISLSIIDSVLLISASLKFAVPGNILEAITNEVKFIGSKSDLDLSKCIPFTSSIFSDVFFVIVTFLFLECLYTFFRLSETIIAIVDTRGDYMKEADNRE